MKINSITSNFTARKINNQPLNFINKTINSKNSVNTAANMLEALDMQGLAFKASLFSRKQNVSQKNEEIKDKAQGLFVLANTRAEKIQNLYDNGAIDEKGERIATFVRPVDDFVQTVMYEDSHLRRSFFNDGKLITIEEFHPNKKEMDSFEIKDGKVKTIQLGRKDKFFLNRHIVKANEVFTFGEDSKNFVYQSGYKGIHTQNSVSDKAKTKINVVDGDCYPIK